MRLPIHQVDAFVTGPAPGGVFTGNPAAVVALPDWLPDAVLAAIAAENNLAETAFLRGEGAARDLRWFTPAVEVALCGHATLASGHVVLGEGHDVARFATRKAGELTVARAGERLALRLPRFEAAPADAPEGLAEALGVEIPELLRARYAPDEWDDVVVLPSEADVAALDPDMRALRTVGGPDGRSRGVIATARAGDGFASRYFAPAAGIDEDPFTGSAHSVLAPLWAARIGSDVLEARQISARGGAATCRVEAEAVVLEGRAVTYLVGEIEV